MFNILLVIAVFAAICLFQLPGLIRDKYWRDLLIFLAFLLPAFVLCLLQAAGVKLPPIIPAIAGALAPLISGLE